MSTDEQAIRDLVGLWHSATARGDVDTVLGLMAEDVVFLVAGKPPLRGRSSFEQGLRALLTQHRIESTVTSRKSKSPVTLPTAGQILRSRLHPSRAALRWFAQAAHCRYFTSCQLVRGS